MRILEKDMHCIVGSCMLNPPCFHTVCFAILLLPLDTFLIFFYLFMSLFIATDTCLKLAITEQHKSVLAGICLIVDS